MNGSETTQQPLEPMETKQDRHLSSFAMPDDPKPNRPPTAFEEFKARTEKPDPDLKRFKPQALSKTVGEEKSYRRGFDQGVKSALLALGLTIEEVRALHLTQRSEAFRYGDQKFPPWNATWKEKRELREAVFAVTHEQLYGIEED